MTIVIVLIGVGIGIPVGRWLTMRRAASTVSEAERLMRRELAHWQEAAARATAETARVAREAEAYKAGCQHGREEVISIVPLLIETQRRAADEARASENGLGAVVDSSEGR
jgi:hypothetical protein